VRHEIRIWAIDYARTGRFTGKVSTTAGKAQDVVAYITRTIGSGFAEHDTIGNAALSPN
jgi:hypothetical protein